ncbi:hypothetical protein ABI59_11940 [Acidobacteria bacterium Mor1]|nr:hypothetical protein ABI59_11940 [Acidobacteria bacterium Mor1]
MNPSSHQNRRRSRETGMGAVQAFRDVALLVILVLVAGSVRIGPPTVSDIDPAPRFGGVHAAEPAPADSPQRLRAPKPEPAPMMDAAIPELECGSNLSATYFTALPAVERVIAEPNRLEPIRLDEDSVIFQWSGGDGEVETFSFEIDEELDADAMVLLRKVQSLASIVADRT